MWEIESNPETFQSAAPSNKVIRKPKGKKDKKNSKIFPSEFSTFSYQPQFIRPMSSSRKNDTSATKPESMKSQLKMNANQKVIIYCF